MISPLKFRFMVVSASASQSDDGVLTIRDVVDNLRIDGPQRIELCVSIGIAASIENTERRVALVAKVVEKRDLQTVLTAHSSTQYRLPDGHGPQTFVYTFPIFLHQSGVYLLQLVDLDGSFSDPNSVLANYMFSVKVG